MMMERREKFETDRDIKHFAEVQLWLKQVRSMWHLGLIVSQTGHFPQASVTAAALNESRKLHFCYL